MSSGRPAIAVVGNAGTTNTGSVDPLRDIAAVAREVGAWFYIDGAYGAAQTGPGAIQDPGAPHAAIMMSAWRWPCCRGSGCGSLQLGAYGRRLGVA